MTVMHVSVVFGMCQIGLERSVLDAQDQNSSKSFESCLASTTRTLILAENQIVLTIEQSDHL